MSKIAVIDADLIGRRRHNFPNLTCMKISGYHKNLGDDVTLQLDYDDLDAYDKVYIAKVFTDTYFPDGGLFGKITDLPNVYIGGTGFYYDNAKPLPRDVEHTRLRKIFCQYQTRRITKSILNFWYATRRLALF